MGVDDVNVHSFGVFDLLDPYEVVWTVDLAGQTQVLKLAIEAVLICQQRMTGPPKVEF